MIVCRKLEGSKNPRVRKSEGSIIRRKAIVVPVCGIGLMDIEYGGLRVSSYSKMANGSQEVSVVPPEGDMTRWKWRRSYRARARRPATKLRDTVWARLAAKAASSDLVAQRSSDSNG
jgi:hypothetical protein